MFASLKDALEDLKKGKAIILVDDDNRENEGDIIFAASKASYDLVKFLVNEVRGLICLPLSEEIARTLNLGLMVQDNTDRHHTAFTQSVDAFDTTTGISVADRLLTIQKLGDPNTKPEDLRRPGHVFPLIAKKDGVFVRRGHTEGCVDLLKMAGLYEVGVVCEILNPSGEMARLSTTLPSFAKEHDLKIISIGQIYNERLKHESTIEPIAEALLPTKLGSFTIEGFKDKFTAEEAVVLKKGDLNGAKSPLCAYSFSMFNGGCFS
jgi:3,4-dihydroxy 2-butanone 4-phosphate synthase/GTP cyclohydrolase II